jgi:pyroglutamyl-peptidase
MTRAIRAAGLPASVSNSAGTYVCNHIMYQVQYMRDKEFLNIQAGFMHIPFLPDQVTNRPNTPSLGLDDDVRGITAAITAIVERDGQGDIETVEGTIA